MADNDYEVKEALKWGLDPNTMVKTPNADHTLLTLCAEAGSPKVAEVSDTNAAQDTNYI